MRFNGCLTPRAGRSRLTAQQSTGSVLMPACPPPPPAVGAVSAPKKPFAAIVGGSKVSTKIGVIEALLQQCDKLVLG